MKVKRLTETAKLPTKAYFGDLGYDLYADESLSIRPGEVARVHTGIAIEFPDQIGGIIKGRSGMALSGINVLGGVVDSLYRGEIVVLLTTHATACQHYIGKGQKIAQLILTPILNYDIEETTELLQTARGDKGFGSSGQ